jgi:hypothetical protein
VPPVYNLSMASHFTYNEIQTHYHRNPKTNVIWPPAAFIYQGMGIEYVTRVGDLKAKQTNGNPCSSGGNLSVQSFPISLTLTYSNTVYFLSMYTQ